MSEYHITEYGRQKIVKEVAMRSQRLVVDMTWHGTRRMAGVRGLCLDTWVILAGKGALVGWGFSLRVDTKVKLRDRLFTLLNPPGAPKRKCSTFTCFNALILDASPLKIKWCSAKKTLEVSLALCTFPSHQTMRCTLFFWPPPEPSLQHAM